MRRFAAFTLALLVLVPPTTTLRYQLGHHLDTAFIELDGAGAS